MRAHEKARAPAHTTSTVAPMMHPHLPPSSSPLPSVAAATRDAFAGGSAASASALVSCERARTRHTHDHGRDTRTCITHTFSARARRWRSHCLGGRPRCFIYTRVAVMRGGGSSCRGRRRRLATTVRPLDSATPPTNQPAHTLRARAAGITIHPSHLYVRLFALRDSHSPREPVALQLEPAANHISKRPP